VAAGAGPADVFAVVHADGAISLTGLDDLDAARARAAADACARAGGGFDQVEWRLEVPDLHFEQTCPAA
jgi:hypothetical protein